MINIKIPHLANKYGFTLIELVVVFSIMAVLSTIGIASFVNYSRMQTLQQAQNDLMTAINTAKSMSVAQTTASTANGNSLDCSGQSFSGYGVHLYKNTTPNSYALYIKCPTGPKFAASAFLPKNVIFGSSTATYDVFFPILIGGVTGNGQIVLDGSALGLPVAGSLKTIVVDSGGNIGNIVAPTPMP
jgi:prepilin-type N-terminal cleavage/methylation domain-containing protein